MTAGYRQEEVQEEGGSEIIWMIRRLAYAFE